MRSSRTSSADSAPASLRAVTEQYLAEAEVVRQGGGSKGIERQHKLGRLTARARVARLIDAETSHFECGLFAGWNMYQEYGGAPAAGVITTVGQVGGKLCMIIANDASVKPGVEVDGDTPPAAAVQ